MSLNKKQSSTYIKYACGCFLYAPSIYLAYLQRGTGVKIYLQSVVYLAKKHKVLYYKHNNRRRVLSERR